jgi:hypothetical protein
LEQSFSRPFWAARNFGTRPKRSMSVMAIYRQLTMP